MNVLLTTSAAPDQTPFSTTEKRPPVGLGFLISILRETGHNVFFIDNYLSPSDFLETDYLQLHQIDIVGIYTNTICFRDSLRMFYRLEELRQKGSWNGKIIAGGPHASVCPETIPHFVDHIVIGEGEYAIRDIVVGQVKDRIVQYPPIENLNELPMPAWDFFVAMPYEWEGNWLPEAPVFTMNTSRGCPFDCTFCSVGSIWGRRYTYFSANRVVADIEYLITRHGAKGIYFREDNFTLNKTRLFDFCNLMIDRGINIPWVCETRASSLDRETVELMCRAGAQGAYIGVESGSQRLLDFMQKSIKLEDVYRAFQLCHEFGIKTAASVIVGVPTETEQDLQMTTTLINAIKPTVTWFNVFVGIPKSKLYTYVLENNQYEYIDDRGLVYLNGHNDRIHKWYGKAWNAELPIQLQNNTVINPRVSVVMSVYNGEKYLREAIQSILKQTFNNFEFLIVNDASNDKTAEILDTFNDPRIIVFTNEQNIGLTKSLNKVLKHCRSELIARMDADDISHPFRLALQISFLEKNRTCALVGSSFYVIDKEGKTISHQEVLTESTQIKAGLKNQNWFAHGSVMMRKSALIMAGGYDEEFRFSQDYDLWLKISELYDVANIKEPLYFWRSTEKAISRDKVQEQHLFAELAKKRAFSRVQISDMRGVKSPRVSVIVPTYNRPDTLRDAIRSILNQTFQDFEILVVNDAGRDVSDIVNFFNSPKISYLSHVTNKGLAAARNTGIQNAQGKYIAYLDDDDIYYPEHLETLLTLLLESGEKVAYTDAYRAHQASQDNGEYLITARDVPYSFDFNYKRMLVGNFIPVLCVMHDVECIHEAGDFDEELKSHEDWDLWIRIAQKHFFQHIPKITCEFRWREDGTSMTSSKEPEFISTQERIYQKYHEIVKNMPEVAEQRRVALHYRKKRERESRQVICSIIIPVFNQAGYTAHCLEALYANTGDYINFEVIIIDNASTDETPSFLINASNWYPNLQIIRNDNNLLFAKACNQGAETARGDILVFLNNDTEPESRWLEWLIAPLTNGTDIGMVGAKLLYPDRTIQHGGMVFVATGSEANSVFSVHRFRGANENDPKINTPEEVQAVTGACIAIAKELYFQVGGISEDYGMYYEDVDLCLKVRKAGKKIYYEPRSVLIHYEGKSSDSREAAVMLDAAARQIFIAKWGGELLSLASSSRFSDNSYTSKSSPSIKSLIWLRPDSIGDIVLSNSMLPHISTLFPKATITVVCQQSTADLFEASPHVDAMISFNSGLLHFDENYRMFISERIGSVGADLLLSSVYSRGISTEFLALSTKASLKVAISGDTTNCSAEEFNHYKQFYTTLIPSPGVWKSEMERHLDFLKGLCCSGITPGELQPTIWLKSEDEQFVDSLVSKYDLVPEKTIILFAGAQMWIRIYENYGRALSGICRDNGYSVVAVGIAGERELNQQQLSAVDARTINLCGELTIRQTAALVKCCVLAVGTETGTAHIAAAVGTPHVIVIGGGHFGRFMPYSSLTTLVCLPLDCYFCNWRCQFERNFCIKDIPASVLEAAIRNTLEQRSESVRIYYPCKDYLPQMKNMPGLLAIEDIYQALFGSLHFQLNSVQIT